MDTLDLFQRLSVALAIGLLVGLERGWVERSEAEGGRTAGVRTLALAGLLGGVWGALAADRPEAGIIALALAFAAFAAVLAAYRYREIAAEGTFGATTVVAGLLVFALGALAVAGDMVAAAAGGVATAGLLALKPALHAFLRRLTWPELRAGLTLLAMTVIALPVLPDRPVDPLQALNPREIWLLTVLLAAMSFAGYVAVRIMGERVGLLLSGILGGLVSSTAVTVALARRARTMPEIEGLAMASAAAAGAVSLARVLVLAVLFAPALLGSLAPALGAALAVMGVGAALLVHRSRAGAAASGGSAVGIGNPLELGEALRMGALLALVMLLAKAAALWAGPAGILALAAVSGLADVDAITLSLARLARASLDAGTASAGILLAVTVNMLAKCALALASGGRGPGLRLARLSGLALAAALGMLILARVTGSFGQATPLGIW